MAVRWVERVVVFGNVAHNEKVLQYEEDYEEDPQPHCEPLIKTRWIDVPTIKEV